MKLKVLDWKSAWFENHISDRFFQEMSKLERSTVKSLETSAQWMEQIMIEVGHLAQAMIRLETAHAPEPLIHQAFEKALRLSALSLHLLTTLDGMDRERVHASHPFHKDLAAFAAPGNGAPIGTSPPLSSEKKPEEAPARSLPLAAPLPRGPFLAGRPAAPGRKEPPAPPPEPPVTALGEAPDSPPASGGTSIAATPPFSFSPLVEISGKRAQQSSGRMRDTILSLSTQGLSRAEIEVVTGEPRHIIEAVLNHDRAR